MTLQDIDLSDANFAQLQTIIHANTGITIADGRKSLLLSRLRSRLREIDESDFRSYIALVRRDTSEMQELINRVTTNKTYFYRTPRIWDHFRNKAVQDFLDSGAKRPLRVWSAAASTGEEAHTVGIVLEDVRAAATGFNYKIFGSDISSEVLAHAQAGQYGEHAITQFRKDAPALFEKYMIKEADDVYKVGPDIRTRLSFKLHNLQKPLANTSPFDVVFLRNVLIYFTKQDQEQILRNVLKMMPPGGILYIGESESLSRLDTGFDIVEPMIYTPKGGAR